MNRSLLLLISYVFGNGVLSDDTIDMKNSIILNNSNVTFIVTDPESLSELIESNFVNQQTGPAPTSSDVVSTTPDDDDGNDNDSNDDGFYENFLKPKVSADDGFYDNFLKPKVTADDGFDTDLPTPIDIFDGDFDLDLPKPKKSINDKFKLPLGTPTYDGDSSDFKSGFVDSKDNNQSDIIDVTPNQQNLENANLKGARQLIRPLTDNCQDRYDDCVNVCLNKRSCWNMQHACRYICPDKCHGIVGC